MNKESTMNEVCCIYELSEEQLDEVNGGYGKWGYWKGVATAAAAGATLGVVGSAFAVGVYNGYYDSHHSGSW